jgi:large subunit ribosomal protein L6
MSRVGKKPIKVPAGVKVSVSGQNIEVSGKGGKLNRVVPNGIKVAVTGDTVNLTTSGSTNPKIGSLHGLWRTLLNNMITGVTEGYSKTLELQGVGYRAQAKGSELGLTLGFSHPVEFPLPAGIKATVEANTKITLSGADKELLGSVAAKLRKVRPPEPYKGKGIRYLGEHITLKQGKAAGGGK